MCIRSSSLIAGIGWELVFKAVRLDTGILPDFSTPPQRHSQHQVRVNGPLFAAILEEAFVEAGGRLHYYELPRAIRPVECGYELELIGRESERRVVCRQLIDCTGDANLLEMLGLPRLREKTTQPGTMMFELGAFYPIDLHDEHGVAPQPLRPGIVPTVPLGALIPKGSRNLLVAGRVVSSDRLANAALRVQASCMAMGQAAGAAAALAARAGITPSHVPLAELRQTLQAHGAIVPGT